MIKKEFLHHLLFVVSILGIWACSDTGIKKPAKITDGTDNPGTDGDVDADSDSDTDSDADTNSNGDADADSDTDADADTDTDADADTDTDADADTDTDADADTDTDADTGCVPGSKEACFCSGIITGQRTCTSAHEWGPCICEEPPDSDIISDTDSQSNSDSETETETEEPPPPRLPKISCPPGTFEFNIRDIWSSLASPSLNEYLLQPDQIMIYPKDYNGTYFGAKLNTFNCEWYTTCLPVNIEPIVFQAIDPETQCTEDGRRSAPMDFSEYATGEYPQVWVTYEGSDINFDYMQAGWQDINPVGPNGFAVATEMADQPDTTDPFQVAKQCNIQEDMITLHFRWPWSDSRVTGLSGTACEDNQAGISTPPYPPVLRVSQPEGCNETIATLERQDQICPWYKLMIPRSQWKGEIKFEYPEQSSMLFTAAIPLPETQANELWLVYEGAPDDDSNPSGGNCMNWSQRNNVYKFYEANLGPGYTGCGGGEAIEGLDCADIRPLGHSVIHFRYIWAGQKTFTYFPRAEFMPTWIVLEVNGGGGNKDVICWREADSPWFRCPVPNAEFYPGATWRAVDKNHDPEWNTVAPREDFPSEPGTYWLRWTYGKPDIPATSRFEFTKYYPDGVEWAAMGDWGNDFCFSDEIVNRPPIKSDGFYPWNETHFKYGFGQSIAKWYPKWEKYAAIQQLLNYVIYERFQMWKEKYIAYDDCGPGTARVKTDPPETVSEGQGYGMAISAIIGDKTLFGQLWKFVRYNLTKADDQYCGGLMAWQWEGEHHCRPLDSPCNKSNGEECGQYTDSAFDGDIDIAIGLLYAAWQWPEYTQDAIDWVLKMECEINPKYDGIWNYPTPGDTWNKNCPNYPDEPCDYTAGLDGDTNMSYYGPGFFRAFGDFLMTNMDELAYLPSERIAHRDFWYRTAETVWEMTERCYNDDIHPALYNDWGTYENPCSRASDNYNWSRALFRMAVDVAWYAHEQGMSETVKGSSRAYPTKSQMQAKIDLIQNFYAHEFPPNNPPEPNANRFSTICRDLQPSGDAKNCDPAYDHNSYFVGTAMSAFVTLFDNDGKTSNDIRLEALEEAVSSSIQNDRYYQESLGLYTLLFLTGNMPRPFSELDDNPPVV